MTDQTFTLKEIEAAMAECESLDEYICQGDLLNELTKPKQEFAQGQIVMSKPKRGRELPIINGNSMWIQSNPKRPLTPEEAGPHLVPRAEFEKLRDASQTLRDGVISIMSRDYSYKTQSGAIKSLAKDYDQALDSLPENLK